MNRLRKNEFSSWNSDADDIDGRKEDQGIPGMKTTIGKWHHTGIFSTNERCWVLMQTIITFASLDLYKEEAIGADVEKHINYFCVFFCNKDGHILLIFLGKYRRTRQRWWISWFSVPLVGCLQPFQGMSSWTMVKKMKMWKQDQQLANNSSMWPIPEMGKRRLIPHFCESFMLIWRRVFLVFLDELLQLEAGMVDITWSIGDPQIWMDPWMAMRNESYRHLHHRKQAATMTSCRHTRCKRCCRSGFCSQWENQLSSSWTKTKWDLILSERVDSMTISRVVGGVKHPGLVGGLIADLQIDCSTLWKQLSYFARPPRICWNTLAEKRWVYSCGRGAFQRFVVNCLHSGPVHRNNPKMNIGGWDCHHACLLVCLFATTFRLHGCWFLL